MRRKPCKRPCPTYSKISLSEGCALNQPLQHITVLLNEAVTPCWEMIRLLRMALMSMVPLAVEVTRDLSSPRLSPQGGRLRLTKTRWR